MAISIKTDPFFGSSYPQHLLSRSKIERDQIISIIRNILSVQRLVYEDNDIQAHSELITRQENSNALNCAFKLSELDLQALTKLQCVVNGLFGFYNVTTLVSRTEIVEQLLSVPSKSHTTISKWTIKLLPVDLEGTEETLGARECMTVVASLCQLYKRVPSESTNACLKKISKEVKQYRQAGDREPHEIGFEIAKQCDKIELETL